MVVFSSVYVLIFYAELAGAQFDYCVKVGALKLVLFFCGGCELPRGGLSRSVRPFL